MDISGPMSFPGGGYLWYQVPLWGKGGYVRGGGGGYVVCSWGYARGYLSPDMGPEGVGGYPRYHRTRSVSGRYASY